MRKKAVLYVGVLTLALAPTLFGAFGECKVCAGGYDPISRTGYVQCAEPFDGEYGSTQCWVNCGVNPDESGSCYCDDSWQNCYYIVVQG